VLNKKKIIDVFGVSVPDWKLSLTDCVSRYRD